MRHVIQHLPFNLRYSKTKIKNKKSHIWILNAAGWRGEIYLRLLKIWKKKKKIGPGIHTIFYANKNGYNAWIIVKIVRPCRGYGDMHDIYEDMIHWTNSVHYGKHTHYHVTHGTLLFFRVNLKQCLEYFSIWLHMAQTLASASSLYGIHIKHH